MTSSTVKQDEARATQRSWLDVLSGTAQVPKFDKVLDAMKDKEIAAWKANDKAYGDLLLSMDIDKEEGMVAFDIMVEVKTDELPKGDTYLAWKNLKDKYKLRTTACMLELMWDFQSCKLKNLNKDPHVWLNNLSSL